MGGWVNGWVRRFLKWGFCRCVMKDIDLQEVQHVYVGVWSSDRRAGYGLFFLKNG